MYRSRLYTSRQRAISSSLRCCRRRRALCNCLRAKKQLILSFAISSVHQYGFCLVPGTEPCIDVSHAVFISRQRFFTSMFTLVCPLRASLFQAATITSGPHHRQSVDVRTTFRAPGPEGDGCSQRLVRPSSEYRRSRVGSPPNLRGSDPVPGPLWGTGVGPRPDGQPSQSYPGEETAKDDRYPNSQRISNNILRVGDSAGGVPPRSSCGPSSSVGCMNT
jgi:hypothetical protein